MSKDNRCTAMRITDLVFGTAAAMPLNIGSSDMEKDFPLMPLWKSCVRTSKGKSHVLDLCLEWRAAPCLPTPRAPQAIVLVLA